MTIMTGEDLYREVQCPRCGGKRLAVASFCPHCGYVPGDSWFEKISKAFRTSEPAGAISSNRKLTGPMLVSIVVGVYFLYLGITEGSFQAIVVGILSFYFALRSWFAPPKPSHGASNGSSPSSGVEELRDNPLENKFFCENCGTQVSRDAIQCPKCGRQFAG